MQSTPIVTQNKLGPLVNALELAGFKHALCPGMQWAWEGVILSTSAGVADFQGMANKSEPWINPRLQEIAGSFGGRFHWLDYDLLIFRSIRR